jgi:hypothetical protein
VIRKRPVPGTGREKAGQNEKEGDPLGVIRKFALDSSGGNFLFYQGGLYRAPGTPPLEKPTFSGYL